MCAGSTALIARKSIRARWGRTLAIGLAITAGVSFVVGSFVLADSLRATFNQLFEELGQDVDLVSGDRGEFTVWVGDAVVARKSWQGVPEPDDAAAAVQAAL